MKKVFFYTLGCRVNQYDTESLRAGFSALGFEPVLDVALADVCVVNTCSVTAESDRKCRSQIRRLKRLRPEVFMAVTGCYAEGSPGDLEQMPEVDLVVGGKNRGALPMEVLQALGLRCPDARFHPSGNDSTAALTVFAEKTRAFIKIEDGCNQMCTYCRIPFYRGRARSRCVEEIVQEVRRLSDKGYGEVVLCGIQLGAFGRDTGQSLPTLLEQLEQLPDVHRIRLSSIEPDDVDEDLIDVLVRLPKVAPHLHLPLQSGDNGVLGRMRRRYTYEEFRDMVARLRDRVPDYAVSSDIMVGFPGEDEEAFEHSLRAIREIEFCRLHLFRYSVRPGTKAAQLPGRVPKPVIDRRREEMGRVAGEVVNQVRARQIGRTLSVLLEEPGRRPGTAVGFSENYLRVEMQGYSGQMSGRIVPVRILGMDEEVLRGRLTHHPQPSQITV
jgi:threonylcarbamoyladenosine tRNA methylthiotransferase MtaB